MAASRRRSIKQAYVYGSAVHAESAGQYFGKMEGQDEKAKQEDPLIRRNQQNALRMDLPYVAALTIAVACVLVILVNYLHVQSAASSRIRSIEKLESELETLKLENDELETRINASIDLDRIYRVATKELGMVHANQDQVVLYDKTESEYVRQYEDITEH